MLFPTARTKSHPFIAQYCLLRDSPTPPRVDSARSNLCALIGRRRAGEEAALSPAKLSNSDSSKLLTSSPSVSPSQSWLPSPSHDPQWYPSDSSDSTLGCLLCESTARVHTHCSSSFLAIYCNDALRSSPLQPAWSLLIRADGPASPPPGPPAARPCWDPVSWTATPMIPFSPAAFRTWQK